MRVCSSTDGSSDPGGTYLSDCYGSVNVPAEPPLTFGSHQGKLVERIRNDPDSRPLPLVGK